MKSKRVMDQDSYIAQLTGGGNTGGPNYDNDIGYRDEEEFNEWKEKDPIKSSKNSCKRGRSASKETRNSRLNSYDMIMMHSNSRKMMIILTRKKPIKAYTLRIKNETRKLCTSN